MSPTVPALPPALRPPGEPELGPTGTDLLEATRPLAYADAENGFAWANLLGALSLLLDPVAEIVRDDEEGNLGWTLIASPRRCPPSWLRVLAQWAGIRRWDAMSEEDLRVLIGHAPGLWRGTREAMVGAVRRYFPPGFEAGRFLFFQERAGGAYGLRVFTYTFVEPLDHEAVGEALRQAKPAGIWPFYFETRRGQTYGMLRDRVADYAEAFERYANYWAMLSDEPTEGPG